MAFIKVSTGTIIPNKYPASLANSVHLSLREENGNPTELNQGYGMLFPKAVIREDNTIEERGCIEPKVCKKDDTYYFRGLLVNAAGEAVDGESYAYWCSEDFLSFEECEAVDGNWQDSIEIPEEMVQPIRNQWMPIYAVEVKVPEHYRIKELADLDKVRIPVVYSDGSVHGKKVDFRRLSLHRTEDGHYSVEGTMKSVETGFPRLAGYADPVVFRFNGAWYLLATNDNVDDIGIYCRKSDTVEGLFEEGCREQILLNYNEEKGFCQTFWAPEFHIIGGRLYILFAVSGKQWGPQCHMMRLKRGGRTMHPEDWEEPIRVTKPDGTPLTTDGITLDMTYFKAGETSYLCWSYRYGIGTPKDTGSMLYIASCDEMKPWELTSEPVLISRPMYGWEHNSGTINNEGPYALIFRNTIFLAYSGGDACGYYYVVGYLTADMNSNLLDPASWRKTPAPVFSSASVEGIQGPGHNSFFTDGNGDLMIAYHAQEREKYFKRCSAFHRVHWDKQGFPRLNVVGERDLPENMKNVTLIFDFE